jgi:hypothetical protein
MKVLADAVRERTFAAAALSLCALVAPPVVQSQVPPEIANCSELKDKATSTEPAAAQLGLFIKGRHEGETR